MRSFAERIAFAAVLMCAATCSLAATSNNDVAKPLKASHLAKKFYQKSALYYAKVTLTRSGPVQQLALPFAASDSVSAGRLLLQPTAGDVVGTAVAAAPGRAAVAHGATASGRGRGAVDHQRDTGGGAVHSGAVAGRRRLECARDAAAARTRRSAQGEFMSSCLGFFVS